MSTLTRLSTFNDRLDRLMMGIRTDDLSETDRDAAIRHAAREYGQDRPRRETIEFAGDGGSYYLMYGNAEDVDEAGRDAGIDLASSGADQKLGVLFTLDYRMEVHQVNLWLSRTGTPAGTCSVALYTVASNLPDKLIATSSDVDPDGLEGAPAGIYNRVRFPFPADEIIELPAGTYAAVLQASGYTYANGTTEIILGVDQSGVTNTVATYNGTVWSAYGTDSAGIVEVLAGIPGWRDESGAIVSVEYPAASISANEQPQMLEDEDYRLFRAADGIWIYFPNHAPAATEKVRLTYSRPYSWLEAADPLIDTPEIHFEAICNLAAAMACEWLAVRYGQNRDSTISADSVERRTQADVYMSLAGKFRSAYKMLVGLGKAEILPGQVLADVDYAYEIGADFLFHRRGRR